MTVTGDLQYRLGDLEAWAKEGCSYQAAGYLSLVEETYPAVNGGGYIERYLNGEISTQEATNISNAIENMMFSITKDIDTYKRLINKYDAGKSNVAYYYRSINGAVYTNLKLEEGGKEDLGQYLCYDDEDIHFDTNINNLEEYFYQDETYITGNMDTDAVFMMGVNAKLPYKDHFYKAKESYNRLHPWIKISIITTFVSIIGWIAALVYLSTVTGRKSHEDEVHLNGFDKIKTEIVIVAGILLISAGNMMTGRLRSHSWEISGLLIMGGILAFVGNACFLLFYLSMIRRLRAGTLWNNSVFYMVIDLIQTYYRGGKATGRFLVLYILEGAVILIFAAWGYYYSQPLFLAALAILLIVFGIFILKDRVQRQQIIEGIEEIKSGNLEYKIRSEEFTGDNKILSEGINNLGDGLEKAVDASMENEKIENEKVNNYIHILKEKSARLEQLTEDLVEASKISSGNIVLEMVRINLVELVYQTAGEFNEKFEQRNLTIFTKMPKESIVVMADGRRIWRVLENLYNNVAKYALEGTRVYVELDKKEDEAVFSIKNISSKPLNIPSDELTERFIRGDVSRTTEGSGLGLSIAKNLTTLMGGTFDIILDGDLFKVMITFPLAF